MKRLRIEFGGKTLDVGFRDLNLPALEAHSDFEIFKPFDHFFSSRLTRRNFARSRSSKDSQPQPQSPDCGLRYP
jgi:hypothetical protein